MPGGFTIWWVQSIFKYSWKVIVLNFIFTFILANGFMMGFDCWGDDQFQFSDIGAPLCFIISMILLLSIRRLSIREFNEQYPDPSEKRGEENE
jgi:hypothetical protein